MNQPTAAATTHLQHKLPKKENLHVTFYTTSKKQES